MRHALTRWVRFNLHHITALFTLAVIAAGVLISHWIWFALIPAAGLTWLVVDGIARPGSSVFYPTITHGPRVSPRVALTFDDGPDPTVTPHILDLLAQAQAQATFFVIGYKLTAAPHIGQRIVTEGHALGNHSWQHSRLTNFYFSRRYGQAIDRCDDAIASLPGNTVNNPFRPPIGLKSGELAKAAYARGAQIVAWSLHSHDTRLQGADAIAERVLSRVRNGDIILLHDGHDWRDQHRRHTVEALRLILAGLQQKKLNCVTVPDLLAGSHEADLN